MVRFALLFTSLALIAASQIGCGTACENARNRIEGRYEECEIQLSEPTDPPTEEACSASDAEYLECIANCVDSASCEALSGEDPVGGVDFGACYGSCAN